MHWGILGAPKTFYGARGSRQMPGLPNSTARHCTYGLMRAAAACLPRSDTFGDKALIRPACAHFSIPVEDAEHAVFVQRLKRKAKANKTMNEKK